MSIAELLVEATLFFLISPTMAAYFLVACAPLSAMIFTVSREDFKSAKNYTGAESLLVCIGASIGFKLVLIVLYWLFTGKNIMLPDMSQMEAVISQLYGSQPEIMSSMSRILSIIPYLMPTMLILYCTTEAFMNYSLCNKLMRKLFPDIKSYPPELPEFRMWRFPASLMIAAFVSLGAGYFIDYDEWRNVSLFIMNLQIILNALMFIEGLSVVFWIMDGWKLRRGVKVFVCILMTIPFFWAWLIVIGMCDIVLNLRERIKFGAK